MTSLASLHEITKPAAPGADYPALFRAYVLRGLQHLLACVRETANLLADDVREDALHTLSFALRLDDAWPLVRDLLLAMAPKMEQLGYRDDWILYLGKGAEYSQRGNDTLAEGEFRFHMGHLYRLQGQFDLAHQCLTASLTCFAMRGQTSGQARALNELAFAACLQQRYAEANQLVEAALNLASESDLECAMSYRIRGIIAVDHGCWQEAEAYHRQALAICKTQGDKRRTAWCLQNLGYALQGQDKFAEAIHCHEQAAAILDDLQDKYHWAIVQMNLGADYRLNHQPNEALVCHLRSEEIFRQASDKLNLAKIYTHLGLDYLALQKYQEAEQAFLFSMDRYAELGDESWRLNAVDGLAMSYLAQKMYLQASAVLEPAIAALSCITDMPNYQYLHQSLTTHLQEAKQGLVGTVSSSQ